LHCTSLSPHTFITRSCTYETDMPSVVQACGWCRWRSAGPFMVRGVHKGFSCSDRLRCQGPPLLGRVLFRPSWTSWGNTTLPYNHCLSYSMARGAHILLLQPTRLVAFASSTSGGTGFRRPFLPRQSPTHV
jgi:hypothetical protein